MPSPAPRPDWLDESDGGWEPCAGCGAWYPLDRLAPRLDAMWCRCCELRNLKDRREAADTLYVVLRMGRVRGWARLVVAWSMRRGTFVGVELAAGASEEDARTWASLFGARYRVSIEFGDLLGELERFDVVWMNGGVGELLDGLEEEQRRREAWRRERR